MFFFVKARPGLISIDLHHVFCVECVMFEEKTVSGHYPLVFIVQSHHPAAPTLTIVLTASRSFGTGPLVFPGTPHHPAWDHPHHPLNLSPRNRPLY